MSRGTKSGTKVIKDRFPATRSRTGGQQSPGSYFHSVDQTADLQPQVNYTGRDALVTRGGSMEDGNKRNSNKLAMEKKGVQGTFGTGPAYFRSGVLADLRGFKQAKDVASECAKPHRVSNDPTPRQAREPAWQRWTPREDV